MTEVFCSASVCSTAELQLQPRHSPCRAKIEPGEEPFFAGESNFAIFRVERIEVATENLSDVLVAAQ